MNKRPIKTVVIPLAFNHPLLNSGCTGAVCRLEAGIQGEDIDTTLIIQTAGTSAAKPRTDTEDSLSVGMLEYLHKYNHPWRNKFITHPITWGTRGEIWCGFRLIRQLGIAKTTDKIRVVISSSPLHIFRIKMWYTWLYKPKNWDIEYKVSKEDMSVKDQFMEIFKHLHGLLYTIGMLYSLYRLRRFRRHLQNKKRFAIL